jgi:hypothetical protein
MLATLPDTVLDHLERMSSSPFVHAFLIRFIAEDRAGKHRLSECARNFAGTTLGDLPVMRNNLPDAGSIIGVLRETGNRLRAVSAADSAKTLGDLVERLRADPSAGNVDAFLGALRTAAGKCPGRCKTLDEVVTQLEALRIARVALEQHEGQARQAAEEATQAEKAAQAATAQRVADAEQLRRLEGSTEPAEAAAAAELRARHDRAKTEEEAALARLARVRTVADGAEGVRQAAVGAVSTAAERVGAALARVQDDLRALSVPRDPVGVVAGGALRPYMRAVDAPPPASPGGGGTTRSPNILLELTDFVIARMRREAVNSFIVTLHGQAKKNDASLTRAAFPDTWELMEGLPERTDGVLNAVDVGRVPLSAWRGSLASDFVALPVTLLKAGSPILCPPATPGGTPAVLRARADSLARCRAGADVLKPLLPLATRLLEGDPVFDILRDAATFAPRTGLTLPAEWPQVVQGLTMIGDLAEAFSLQRSVPDADPRRHPYVLTARAIGQVPPVQQQAFLRLLLVHAAPSTQVTIPHFDETRLQAAPLGAVRILERIAGTTVSADPKPAEAARVFRDAFDAALASTDLARTLVPAHGAARLDAVGKGWRGVASTVEAIVARDFGLAFARTNALLHDVRGRQVPSGFLTMSALGLALSEARNREQVQAAFEAAASPVGGWQGKRYGEVRGSITAYPGFVIGGESVLDEDGDAAETSEWALTGGGSLPIGMEWQLGKGSPRCIICGAGLFLPLMDLGALLSYRLNHTGDVGSEPNTSLRQVFAPGLYLTIPISRKVPATILVGGQLMPSLRKVEADGGEESRSAFRGSVGLSMDILLFKF